MDPERAVARQPWSALGDILPGDDAARQAGVQRLRTYALALLSWNQGVSNLISRHDELRLVERHLRESVEPAATLAASGLERWVDLGSGAGLPAIPLALLGVGRHWTLIESRRNKTLFLRKLKQDMALDDVEVVTARLEAAIAEGAEGLACDGFTSRATMTIGPTLELAARIVRPGGAAFLWKGSSHAEERRESSASWSRDWVFEDAMAIGGGPNVICVFRRQ